MIGSCDIDGDALGGEPEFTATLNSEFYLPIGEMEWYIRGLYKYTDERDNQQASAGIGDVLSTFEETHALNLYTGLRSEDLTWDVSLWAKNVLDSDEVTFQQGPDQYDTAFSTNGGNYTQTNIEKEPIVGVTARYNF